MKWYKKLVDRIEKVENFLASFLLGVLACVIMMEVVSRYLLNHPFPWVFELTMLMIAYIVFLGIPVMYKQKSLILLEFIFNRLSLKVQRPLSLIWEILIGIFLVYLSVGAYELQSLQKRYTSPTLDISFQFFTLPILLGALSMLLFNIYAILDYSMNWAGQRRKLGASSMEMKGKGGMCRPKWRSGTK